jgi:hypothetical protein
MLHYIGEAATIKAQPKETSEENLEFLEIHGFLLLLN